MVIRVHLEWILSREGDAELVLSPAMINGTDQLPMHSCRHHDACDEYYNSEAAASLVDGELALEGMGYLVSNEESEIIPPAMRSARPWTRTSSSSNLADYSSPEQQHQPSPRRSSCPIPILGQVGTSEGGVGRGEWSRDAHGSYDGRDTHEIVRHDGSLAWSAGSRYDGLMAFARTPTGLLDGPINGGASGSSGGLAGVGGGGGGREAMVSSGGGEATGVSGAMVGVREGQDLVVDRGDGSEGDADAEVDNGSAEQDADRSFGSNSMDASAPMF